MSQLSSDAEKVTSFPFLILFGPSVDRMRLPNILVPFTLSNAHLVQTPPPTSLATDTPRIMLNPDRLTHKVTVEAPG